MIIIRILALYILIHSFVVSALNFEVASSIWHVNSSGSINSLGSDGVFLNIDLDDQLTMETPTQGRYSFTINHDATWLPQISLGVTQLNINGSGRPLASSISNLFDDLYVPIEGNLDLSHYQATFFWPIWQPGNWLIDLGFTFRQFDGELAFEFTYLSESIPIQANINSNYGFIYLSGLYQLPWDGFSLKLYSHLGHNFKRDAPETGIDLDAMIKYDHYTGIGLGLGYHYMDINLTSVVENRNTDYTLDISGPYLRLAYRF